MSTYYSLIKKIPGDDVFDGRLEDFGVREHIVPDQTTNTYRCLTDGRDYVWVQMDGNGFFWHVRGISKILYIVADVFETDIVSENQGQFWGFDTQEEWDAWNRAEATKAEEDFYKAEEDFYKEVVKFVRGEAHDIKPGTIRMIKAEIAKRLIAESPDLLAEDKRPDLIKAVNLVYDRDHAVVVTLTEKDLAFVDMVATHEDDLPQA